MIRNIGALAVALTAVSSISLAQSICDSVLTNRSETSATFEFRTQSTFQALAACERQLSGYNDYRDWAEQSGINIAFADAIFDFSERARNSSEEFLIEFNERCSNLRSREASNFLTGIQEEQYYQSVYTVWLSCVQSWLENQQEGAFARVEPKGDFKLFTVNLTTKLQTPPDHIQVLTYEPGPPTLKCTFRGEPVLDQKIPYRQTIPLSCEKQADSELRATITTNTHTVSQIHLPKAPKPTPLNDRIEQVDQRLSDLLPIGAVMAFNRDGCPDNGRHWEEFIPAQGRVLVGANPAGAQNGLSARSVGNLGGVERHPLSLSEMPRHRHSLSFQDDAWRVRAGRGGILGGADGNADNVGEHRDETIRTTRVGDGEPHNNMPPFYVLTYCVLTGR